MFYKSFTNIASNAPIFDTKPKSFERIGNILMRDANLDPGLLAKALAIQNHHDAKLGEILVSLKAIKPDQLDQALAQQHKLKFEYITPNDIRVDGIAPFDLNMLLDLNFVPIKAHSKGLEIALSDPKSIPTIKNICKFHGIEAHFILSHPERIHDCIQSLAPKELVDFAETVCPISNSCRSVLSRRTAVSFLMVFGAGLSALWWLGWLQISLFLLAITIFISNGALKLLCLLAYKRMPVERREPKGPIKLEKVSVLVPLLKEHEVFNRLIPRLTKTDYPKELLDICLICEDDDEVTKKATNTIKLPHYFRVFIVPKGTIETKPRAMNFALPFCKGDIITVYDAEDAPEPNQIYKAVRHLNSGDENLVCVQARLDFFNQDTNWLSRCFTIEYSMLFRVILQGLQRLNLPIPLGGTSMFIRKDALVKLGYWDAHNVTEDADLGFRLYRAGMRVECLDSTTYEEANHRVIPWMKQRSRWLKGFIITWLTHIRNPISLQRDLGWKSLITLNILTLGTFLTYILIPLVLPFWLLSFGFELAVFSSFPAWFSPMMILPLIVGDPLLLFIGCVALDNPKQRKLRAYLPLMLIYWPMASFAAYKALVEIFLAPNFWDKTEHGINDESYMDEISELTTIPNQDDYVQSYLSVKGAKT